MGELPTINEVWAEVRILRHDLGTVRQAQVHLNEVVREVKDGLTGANASHSELVHDLFGTPGRQGDTGALGYLQDVASTTNRQVAALQKHQDELKVVAQSYVDRLQWRLLGGMGALILALIGDIVAHVVR